MPLWTDVVQAIGSLCSFLFTFVGFVLLFRQVRQIERTIRGDVNERLYNQNLEILKCFVDDPEIRPFFYDNKEVEPTHPSYLKIVCIAEILASYLELVYVQLDEMPPKIRGTWKTYMKAMYANSPSLRQHLKENEDWYYSGLISVLGEIEEEKKNGFTKRLKQK
jgi:hypothetical protein